MTIPPNTHTPPTADALDRLDRYLDGLMEGAELAAFEIELQNSPALREQVALQRNIDAGIKQNFSYAARPIVLPPEPLRLAGDGVLPPPSPARSASPLHRLKWIGLAAAVLLAGAGVWSAYIHLTTPTFDRIIAPGDLYAEMQARNFPIEFVCSTDAEFAKAIADRFGDALVLAQTSGVRALGWAYGDNYNGTILGPKTLVLITTVDRPGSDPATVLVLIDAARNDRSLSIPPSAGVRLFRREVGSIVLYEITPLDTPRVLEHLKPAP